MAGLHARSVPALLVLVLAFGPVGPASAATLAREVVEARLRRSAPDNAVRRVRLAELFTEAGCAGGCQSDQPVDGAILPNLVCALEGATTSRIVIGAHFDSVGAGAGVVDNWSGAALLPSLFEGLRQAERRHTFVFVGFTDEEKGLVGSEWFAGKLPSAERKRIRAMVNLDSLGLGPVRVWTSRADARLVDLLRRAGQEISVPVADGNVESLGTSDSESFARRSVPSITLHSVTPDNFSVLHSARDELAAVVLPDYYDTYRLLAAYLELLDASLP